MRLRNAAAMALALSLAVSFSGQAFAASGKGAKIEVTSGAFMEGGMIPDAHGFNDRNISPALAWSGIPAGTRSIAVICDDPDAPAGVWVHWVIFNIPASAAGLPEGVGREETLEDGSVQGMNDFRKIGYDGPAPPYGVHRYLFKVYALDTALDLEAGANKKELLAAMAGHVLGEGRLMGRFKKKIDIPADPML